MEDDGGGGIGDGGIGDDGLVVVVLVLVLGDDGMRGGMNVWQRRAKSVEVPKLPLLPLKL